MPDFDYNIYSVNLPKNSEKTSGSDKSSADNLENIERSKRELIEKLSELLKEAENSKNTDKIGVFKDMLEKAEKASSIEELKNIHDLYKNIIYKKASHQARINAYAMMQRPMQEDTSINYQQKLDYLKDELNEYVVDDNQRNEALALLNGFDEETLEKVFLQVLNGRINAYDGITGADAGIDDSRIDAVVRLLNGSISMYEAKFLDDNFEEKESKQIIDTAKKLKISVWEADEIISKILENNNDFSFEEASKYAQLTDEQQILSRKIIDNYCFSALDSIFIAGSTLQGEQQQKAAEFLKKNNGLDAKIAVKYAKLSDEQKEKADKITDTNKDLDINSVINLVTSTDNFEKIPEAIEFMKKYRNSDGKDAAEYVTLSEKSRKNVDALLSNPDYEVLKPSDAIFLSNNIYSKAETDKVVSFMNKYKGVDAKSAIKYKKLVPEMKKSVDKLLMGSVEKELSPNLIIDIAEKIVLSTPEEIEMAADFCKRHKTATSLDGANYLTLGNNKLRRKVDSVLNENEDILPSTLIYLAGHGGKHFNRDIKFLIKNPKINDFSMMTYSLSTPVIRDIRLNNILKKFDNISIDDALDIIDATESQIDRMLEVKKKYPDAEIRDLYEIAIMTHKERNEFLKYINDDKYKGYKLRNILDILNLDIEPDERELMFQLLDSYPDAKIENALEYINLDAQKKEYLDEILFSDEYKGSKLPCDIFSAAENLKTREQIHKVSKFLFDFPEAEITDAMKIASFSDETIEQIEEILRTYKDIRPTDAIKYVATKGFLEGENHQARLKKIIQQSSQNKYQAELLYMLTNMSMKKRAGIFNYNISEEEFYNAVKLLNSSTFKKAYKTPNEFLSDIDIKYTTKVNDKYPELPKEELELEQERIVDFFSENIVQIVRALKYLDTDTVNQMMSKRTNLFLKSLNKLNILSNKNLELLSVLIRKTNSAKNKIELCNLVEVCELSNIKTDILKELANKECITTDDIKAVKKQIKMEYLHEILIDCGYNEKEIEKIDWEKLNFNEEYAHLLNEIRGDELSFIIKSCLKGDFSRALKDKSNKYGKANAQTKELFIKNKLNYDKWLNPDIEDKVVNIDGKKYKFKIWDRNPLEDIFIGNNTNCCTAVGGCNGGATPIYLTNTAFNIVELCDEDGNPIAMSRVFMGKINNKPALMMDTLELSSTRNNVKIRDEYFDYMKKYAQAVTGKTNTPVYYSSSYTKVPTADLDRISTITGFIGSVYPNNVYINSKKNWIKPEMMKCMGLTEWYVVPQRSNYNLAPW